MVRTMRPTTSPQRVSRSRRASKLDMLTGMALASVVEHDWPRNVSERITVWLPPVATALLVIADAMWLHDGRQKIYSTAIGLAASGALFWRKSRPLLVLALTLAATGAFVAMEGRVFPVAIQLVIAVYTIGGVCTFRQTLIITSLATGLVFSEAELISHVPQLQLEDGLQFGGIAAAASIGIALANHQRYRQEHLQRAAERRASDELRMVHEERLRIARELHDSLGHSIAVINVQSGAAIHALNKRPEIAKDTLSNIHRVSAVALEELRATLRVLKRENLGALAADQQKSIHDLPELIENARRAGLPVECVMTGPLCDVPAAAGFAIYRLVQEALTNVIKHAGPVRRVRVELAFTAGRVIVEVTDDGNGPERLEGFGTRGGLAGMRQRIEAVGGRLEVGAAAERGFRVRAEIPMEAT
ncbi:sensor histidine kinase [Streptantibioticus rubrisoli]|uniref:histidine kinase n=1 Tax=Streptantibioticus rubrisoli TaxID=1387313 RepID=A0ABT1PDF4_9ACTN|nr:sensor histidine kinase [Streptantibioticus rubrisoli]MCQ4043406.1 sensor histidine kinase [Streptantibioticus rubrisoli]